MTTITVNRTAPVTSPRGARWAAQAFGAFLNWLEAAGEQRAQRVEAADRLTEAARVRHFAQEMLAQDPRFAADLFAAADRHERS